MDSWGNSPTQLPSTETTCAYSPDGDSEDAFGSMPPDGGICLRRFLRWSFIHLSTPNGGGQVSTLTPRSSCAVTRCVSGDGKGHPLPSRISVRQVVGFRQPDTRRPAFSQEDRERSDVLPAPDTAGPNVTPQRQGTFGTARESRAKEKTEETFRYVVMAPETAECAGIPPLA